MSRIAGGLTLIHVREGTITSTWSFDTTEVREEFERQHRSTDPYDPGWHPGYLPDGTYDDPASDTWIEVEGVVEYVDGDRPEQHDCFATGCDTRQEG